MSEYNRKEVIFMEQPIQQTNRVKPTPDWKKINKRRSWVVILCALCSVLALWYDLVHYQPHMDAGTFASGVTTFCMFPIGVILIVSIVCFFKEDWRQFRTVLLCATIAAVICVFVMNTAIQIPNCAKCEGITSQKLGWLSHWIAGGELS